MIDDFGFNVAILRGIADSGQTSIKCSDLACDLEPPLSKNCKDLTMKLKVKYISPKSFSGANIFVCQLSEGLGMRKVLAHGIRMQKNP